MVSIQCAEFPSDLESVPEIYREYINSTAASLDFQDNESDFARLQYQYSVAGTSIFLARINNSVVGCAAFRKVDSTKCEMKRAFVRPNARGRNVGSKLVKTVLKEAKEFGYCEICLDVLPEFNVALKLYKSYGFKNTKPITNKPVPGTQFLGLKLK